MGTTIRSVTIIAPICTPGNQLVGVLCQPCDVGSYNSTTGGVCTYADIGSFVGTTGATQKIACALGTYTDLIGSAARIPAPAGSFVRLTGSTGAVLCPTGTYQSQTGQYVCEGAPVGTYVASMGSSGFNYYDVGSYQSQTGQITCTPAGLGNYVATTGATIQQMCAANTFSDTIGSTSCTPCPGGYGSATGSMSCIDVEMPILILSGSTGLTLETSTGIYLDVGASWTDNADGSGSILTGTWGSTGSFAVSGTVNMSQTGTYLIQYRKVDMVGNNTIETRIIIVQDTSAPSAPVCSASPSPTSGAVIIICTNIASGDTATIPGLTCTPSPSSGGNVSCIGMLLTSNPIATVTDSSNNISTGTVVAILDTSTPIVALIGSGIIIISEGSVYTESGAIWTDSVDGSGMIVAAFSGIVNTAAIGTYILYYKRIDAAGNISNIVTRTVTVVSSALADTDGDGNTDTIEDAGNNSGDGNGDGMLDSTQTDVASTPNPLTNAYTTLETTGGCTIVSDFSVVTEPSLPTQDDPYSYPLGLNKFEIRCTDPGMTGVVTIYYDRVYDTSQWLWRKFASGSNTYTDIGQVVAVSIGSKTVGGTPVTKVTFSIRDGGLADEDGLVNAVIIDPSGPAVPVSVTPSFGGGGSSSSSQPTSGSIDTGNVVVLDPEDIFNPSITDGYCHTAKTGVIIIDSLTITTDPEFKPSLAFLYAYELTKFNSVDEFGPYTNLTREQAAKIFSNFAINVLCRKPDLSLKISYSDTVNTDPSLKPYIALAYQLGLMKGGEGKFRPFDTITKAELNAVLMRMILKSYLDESGSTWYANYNSVATDLGIIKQGAGLQAVSRDNAALMLFRAYKEQKFSLQDIEYESFVLEDRDEFVK